MRSIYLLLIIDIILTVAAQLSLRTGALRFGTQELSISLLLEPFKNIFLFLGLILYGASFFLYFFILSKIQLSIVYPIAAGSVPNSISTPFYPALSAALKRILIRITKAPWVRMITMCMICYYFI